MGTGSWTAETYTNTVKATKAAGRSTFDYSTRARTTNTWKVHERLDPKVVAGAASPFAGKVMRESRDSADHPNALPIIVALDVTGSNITQAHIIHQALPNLFKLLLTKGYAEDPQIMMAAIGDAYSDRVPLQMGQFESDNRIDDTLAAMILEGGGGGGNHESYELVAYYAARHTATDAWDKRRKRGYLFIIGDERVYSKVRAQQVMALIGDEMRQDLDTEAIFREAMERYDVYYLFVEQASYQSSQVIPEVAGDHQALGWFKVLGQNAIPLRDSEAVCDTIAGIIGLGEGTVDLDDVVKDLKDMGSKSAAMVGKALAKVGARGGGAVAVAPSPAGLDTWDDNNSLTRL